MTASALIGRLLRERPLRERPFYSEGRPPWRLAACFFVPVALAFTFASPAAAQKRSFEDLKAEAQERAQRRALNAKAVRTNKEKATCRCATPRLVGVNGQVVLDESAPISAWIDDSGARLDVFRGRDLSRGLRPKIEVREEAVEDEKGESSDGGAPTAPTAPIAAPLTDEERAIGDSFRLTPFPVEDYGSAEAANARLMRVWSRESWSEPLMVGLLRKQDRVPRDVVGVKATVGMSEPPPPGKAPEMIAAFLGPLESRDTAGCGKTVTHRLIANPAEGSEKIAGWLVKRTDAKGNARVALVDARQVAVFGVGRVQECGQGLTLSESEAMTLEVRPVSSSFGVGEPWVFQTPGPVPADEKEKASDDDGEKKPPMPTLVKAPATHQPDVSNPFVDGFQPRRLSGSKDRVAFGSMAFVVGGAIVIAAFWSSVRRRRRRRVEVHGCPACGEEMALDVADPETDGYFCPSCGQSSVTVLQTPNGPRVRVYPLSEKEGADTA